MAFSFICMQPTLIGKTVIFSGAISDNHVIEDLDAKDLPGLDETPGEAAVLSARLRIATGMIVAA